MSKVVTVHTPSPRALAWQARTAEAIESLPGAKSNGAIAATKRPRRSQMSGAREQLACDFLLAELASFLANL